MAELMSALASEWELLFTTYESFNDQSLSIKNWSVTIGMAALIAAYAAKPVDRPGRPVALLAALSVVPFWITDTIWKMVQEGYKTRLTDIEKALSEAAEKNLEPTLAAFQSFTTWEVSEKEIFTLASFANEFINPTVCLPHAAIFVLGIALAMFHPPRTVPSIGRPGRSGR